MAAVRTRTAGGEVGNPAILSHAAVPILSHAALRRTLLCPMEVTAIRAVS